ncbi:restriction endonuclease subunit S [Thermaerobacillus caldiproteolyticus]|uniref:Type I restriction enzyme S subunit n=1 Tax=Thermaerobacillus caldiproteolyticus TaxID=247480 RepID=A0A7W0C110_9BACL|nr:restriction endonuclease subunit S [Anoxybacillus caldiproteolyticus]MBA2876369.1 type I restriction enzyme S subunit [Anoxybacillus caldiproteolyticus]
MSEWKQISLGNLVESISKRHAFNKDRLIFLNTSDIFNGKVLNNEYTDINTLPGQAKKSIQKNDILFSEIRPANRRFAYIDFESEDYVVSTKLMVLRPKNNDILPKYLYYFLTSEESLRHLQEVAESRSGTFPQITFSEVKEMVINLPPLKEQQRIVEVIDSLTEKIELNLKINKTLEEMAMTLYKHWFVDFGPFQDGEFVESELGMIPKGWEVSSLKEFANILMGQSPKSEFYNQERKGLPFHQGVKDFGVRFPVHTVYCTQELRIANKGDILLSVRAPVGRINIANNKLVIGRGLSALHSKSGHNSFLLYTLKRIFAFEDQYGSGTVFNSINKKDIEQLKFIQPPQEVLDNFENHVSKFDALIEGNTKEIEELQELRDYLLPRLLSGEIDLSQTEKQVEEVL